jgi:hypothetical protein
VLVFARMPRNPAPKTPAAAARLAASALVLVAAAIALTACGGGKDARESGAADTPGSAAATGAQGAREKLEQTTTAAVRTQAGHATIDLRFRLPKAPEAGVAFPLELAVLPGEPTPTLKLEIQPAEGLVLTPVAVPLSYDQVERSSVISVPIELTAAKDGVYLVQVIATEASPTGADSATFQIPVAVNPKALVTALTAQAAAQEAAKAAAVAAERAAANAAPTAPAAPAKGAPPAAPKTPAK